MPKTWVFQSDYNDNTFTTTQHDDGTRSCTCHGCKPLASGGVSCKHTRLIDQGLADQQAISLVKSTMSWPTQADVSKAIEEINEEIQSKNGPKTDYTPELLAAIPQLLTPIELEKAQELLKDDAWGVQEKMDGKRIILHLYRINGGGWGVTAYNRKGKVCDIPDVIADSAKKFGSFKLVKGDCVLDGELIGDVYHAFDLLTYNGQDLRDKRYDYRYALLSNFVHTDSYHINRVPLVYSTKKKIEFFDFLSNNKREGIVFKKLDAPHKEGLSLKQLKYKFYATISCVVIDHSTALSKHTGQCKSSISLGLFEEKGALTLIPVGNCTIPAGWKLPPIESVVEIRYLYMYKGGSLYQPVFLNPRDDVDGDCLADAKYKPEDDPDTSSFDETVVVEIVTPKPVSNELRRRVLWK